MTPDLEFWVRTLTVLALEMGVVVGLAAIVSPRLAAAGHRRLLWLGALTSMLLVLAGEISGIAHSVSRLATSPAPLPAPGVIVTTIDTAPEGAWDSIDAAPGITLPGADTSRRTPATGTWWPGLVWLAGTLALLAYRALGHARLLHRDRRPGFEVEPELREQTARLAERMRLGPVTLRYWTGIRGPLAFGLLRPSIALPRDFVQRFDTHQRDAILLHELAHLAARDPLALLFADVVGALAWWHPAVHWARRQLQAAMEAAADEASTLIPAGRTALAESLVRLARELTTPETARGLGVAGASNRSQLARRVEALLAGSRAWRRSSWRAQCATAAGAASMAFALMVPSWPGRAEAPLSRFLLAASQPSDSAATPRLEPSASNPAVTSLAPTATTTSTSEPPGQTEAPPAKAIEAVGNFPPDSEYAQHQPQWDSVRAWAEQVTWETPSAPDAKRQEPPPNTLLAEAGGSLAAVFSAGAPPQAAPAETKPDVVTLEVKVLEITDRAGTADVGFDWLFGQASVQPDPVRIESPSDGDPAAGSPHAEAFRVEKTRVEGQAAVVSEAQWAALLKVLESRGGVTLLAAPKITTAAGRAAEVQIQDAKTIVTAVDTNGPTSPHVRYHTEVHGFGPRIQIIPSHRSDAWHLALFGGVSEFLGYDDPGTNSVVVHGKEGTLSAQLPLPRLRVRKVLGDGTVSPGHSLLIRGPVTEQVTRTKGSLFRRSRKEVEHRRLYIVVTPIEGE